MEQGKREISTVNHEENSPKNICGGTPIKEGKTKCFNAKAWENMTEEPNKIETAPIEKLMVDEPANFQFHAAYLVYSEAFDNATEVQAKTELNSNLEALKQNKIDYETFYRNIAHYRDLSAAPRQERFSLQTQRKKDWRMKTQKQDRIRRHKK